MKSGSYFARRSGLPGILRKMFLFLTYPFRHWGFLLFVLLVLVALYFVPVYWYKVPRSEIFDWYRGKVLQMQQVKTVDAEKKGTDELVYSESPATAAVGRRGFGQSAGGGIQTVDVLSNEAADVVEVASETVDIEETEAAVLANVQENAEKIEVKKEKILEQAEQQQQKMNAKFVYQSGEYTELDYLESPLKIEGTAKVINANEMMIDETYVFLYGIYANPRTENGVRAQVLLKKVLDDKKVVCNVLAYTKSDKTATAECFVDGESINQFLIEKGYSEKVATK